MKKLYKISMITLIAAGLGSCANETLLDYVVDKPETIANQEVIDAYQELKAYVDRAANPNFKLGTAVNGLNYLNKNIHYRIANSNFDEISAGDLFNHAAIVDENGSLNLDNVTKLAEIAHESEISVYGGSLMSNFDQNATYLKRIIAPIIVTPPAIASSLDLSNLQAGNFTGWTKANNGAGISLTSDGMVGTNSKAIKLVASQSSSSPEDLQLVTPPVEVVAGHTYEVVFYIKSNVAGEGNVSFENLLENNPELDYTNSGTTTASFSTSTSWKEIRFKVKDFNASTFKLKLNLGSKANVQYFVDVNNFYIYDTQGEPSFINLIANGDFEAGNSNGWGGWGGSSTRGLTANGGGYGGNGYGYFVTNPVKGGGYWEVQTALDIPPLEKGVKYTLSFAVKSTDATSSIRPELQNASWQDGADGMGAVFLSNDWKTVEIDVTPTTDARIKLIISFGDVVGTVTLDNFSLVKASGGSSTPPATVEKSADSKREIISGAMNSFISGVIKNNPTIKTWEVVSQPLDDADPKNLSSATGKTLGANEFYWQDYIGKEYGTEAFKIARANANDSDKLFISENNLNVNLPKCDALIDYINYMEAAGAQVDGIATKLRLSTTSSREDIEEMFTKLAASGKLIKVSNLEVSVPDNQLSVANQLTQAEMYKYVVETYFKLVPAGQRYGISVANSVDTSTSKGGLWNSDTSGYSRKPSYSGFADGLKGTK